MQTGEGQRGRQSWGDTAERTRVHSQGPGQAHRPHQRGRSNRRGSKGGRWAGRATSGVCLEGLRSRPAEPSAPWHGPRGWPVPQTSETLLRRHSCQSSQGHGVRGLTKSSVGFSLGPASLLPTLSPTRGPQVPLYMPVQCTCCGAPAKMSKITGAHGTALGPLGRGTRAAVPSTAAPSWQAGG